jgi:tetratricopeptide (TPR) repeat protein
MTPTAFWNARRLLVLVALSIAGMTATIYADRTSESRANRLHRADELPEAAAIYRERVEQDPEAARLRYNLGTTLLRMGEPGAFEELAAGTVAESERLRVRSFYNVGLWSLIQSIMAPSTDSVLFHAANSVEANKAALRLDPEHADAKWNLALAQRILVTSAPEQSLMDPGDISGPDNIGERMESEAPNDLADREGDEDILAAAESESLAGDSLQALTPAEANGILGRGHLDPTRIMFKMLDREGRARRRNGYYVVGSPW